MEHNIAEKSEKIDEMTPKFEELEVKFEARTAAYEKLKKDIVGMCYQSFHTNLSLDTALHSSYRLSGLIPY